MQEPGSSDESEESHGQPTQMKPTDTRQTILRGDTKADLKTKKRETSYLLLDKQRQNLSKQERPLPGRIKKDKKQKVSRRLITNCIHTDEPFYAKGLCQRCYHAVAHGKLSTNCEHGDAPSYARGICKPCYLRQYHLKRKTLI